MIFRKQFRSIDSEEHQQETLVSPREKVETSSFGEGKATMWIRRELLGTIACAVVKGCGCIRYRDYLSSYLSSYLAARLVEACSIAGVGCCRPTLGLSGFLCLPLFCLSPHYCVLCGEVISDSLSCTLCSVHSLEWGCFQGPPPLSLYCQSRAGTVFSQAGGSFSNIIFRLSSQGVRNRG